MPDDPPPIPDCFVPPPIPDPIPLAGVAGASLTGAGSSTYGAFFAF